ncbi:MAG: polysaccharide deacetylase family protein [Erysipelotrichaceae bacterium]|uniref:polysaccharide deacetylase family protein n=1 Tax=Floccifex sp. TaxID=2815810 RepID=UPI002A75FB22|nr:polysaccharide deacetylase family protein [Floccifex sp.]MDD7280926.1 polysaccharide deacetylase family protein [Erysipelotrichaceae bacterium]MDY2958718.1 polysaccharide deacetylase family protein [Floccifex sp.]
MKKKIIGCICFCFIVCLLFIPNEPSIPILGYHDIVCDETKIDSRYTLSLSDFEEQMKYLYEHDFHTLSLDELYDFYRGTLEIDEKSIVLTFDDGYESFISLVKPVLEKYGFNATCFVIGKHALDEKEKYIKENQLINDETVSFYSHSFDLHRKDGKNKVIETMTKNEIEQDFDTGIVDYTYFAFPYGVSSEKAREVIINRKVKMAFSYNQFHNCSRKDDIYYIPRYAIVNFMPMIYFKWIVD